MGAEEHTGDTPTLEFRPDPPEAFSTFEGSAKGHPDRPTKFGCSDVVANGFAVFS
nr:MULTISPECIES: hypothetical protein [unclassified Roseobacter]